MQFTIPFAALALASVAIAAPASEKRDIITSGNSPGSIYRYGDPAECRAIFEQYGACGLSTYFPDAPNLPLVAMPNNIWDNYGASQHNQLCAKVMTMTHNGVTQKVVIADVNEGNQHSIDMCLDDWEGFGGHDGDGTLIQNIDWYIEN